MLEPSEVAEEGTGGARFWAGYAAGWLIYTGLVAMAMTAEDGRVVAPLLGASGNTLPPALLGVPVAARRRDLFRPERGLARTLVVLGGVGLAYALAGGVLTRLLLALLAPLAPVGAEWTSMPVWIHVITDLFLYILMAGFLLWTESIARVRETREAMAREAMLRSRAEAKALRARFNPHFVFNVLHSLMLLVREDPGAAERAIEDVAALIRYGSRLQREERDAVPLQDEMDFARRYLALEAMRLGDRLRVEWEVEEGLGEVPVPALCLQTLLENAVKHGVAPHPDGATVRVSARRESDVVVLSVADDGPGARPDEVDAAPGRGLGLLEERVRTLHGDGSALEWETEPGRGFRVRIRVPPEEEGGGAGARRAGSPAESEAARP